MLFYLFRARTSDFNFLSRSLKSYFKLEWNRAQKLTLGLTPKRESQVRETSMSSDAKDFLV